MIRLFVGSTLLLLANLPWLADTATAAPLNGGWQEQYLGGATDVPFYPDANASYWVYRLDRGTDQTSVGLRIRGQFPRARYMSVTVYDDRDCSVLAHIPDLQIKPATGTNPFGEGAQGADPTGTYEIAIVPMGTPSPPDVNLVEYDPTVPRISVFLRYYLAEGDDTGGVPLPALGAFDTANGDDLSLPAADIQAISRTRARSAVVRFVGRRLNRRLGDLFAASGVGPLLFSFRTDVQRFYANPDNHYLSVPIIKRADQVALIRFIPPTTPLQTSENAAAADTRYWSLGLGDDQSFNTYTLSDFQAKVDLDGYVYVALGDPTPQVMEKVKDINFIPWTVGERGVLIYRNLLTRPGFSGDFSLVPEFTGRGNWRSETAQRFIGDNAPTGALMSVQDFLSLQ